MARVPFIGRLFWREYIALFGSFILIFLEGVIRIITLGLPQPIIRFCYNRSKNLFDRLSSPQSRKSRAQKKSISAKVANASDFTDLCALFGYYAEEHVLQTGDGYLLGLHRLGWRKGEEGMRVNAGESSSKKRVVYLHHGLMMNSEVWVCMTEEQRCLPFQLVEKGYDVWLGNNRGNKYSKKSLHISPASTRFWNFSMDEFAFHDIPDSIDYILNTTATQSLSYIGFSQGTAQAFAALSIHPVLNDKVDVFVALAPAMSPAGLHNGVVDALMKTSPEVIFLAFGRRSILSSATMWQSILYPPIFVRLIDMSLTFLFNWTGHNIEQHQKLAAYPHLYSFTSTKSVVHWFQIIRNKSFQMYDDEVQAPLSISASDRYYKVAKFPTRNIQTPIVLVYGGCDSLVDVKVMLRELPKHTIAREVPHFEHLDFLWAQEVRELVFPHVFEALRNHAPHTHKLRHTPSFKAITDANPQTNSEDEQSPNYLSDGPGMDSEGVPSASNNTSPITSKSFAANARLQAYNVSEDSPSSPATNPTFDLSEFKGKDPYMNSEDARVRPTSSSAERSDGEDSNGTDHRSENGAPTKRVGRMGISIGKGGATVGLGG